MKKKLIPLVCCMAVTPTAVSATAFRSMTVDVESASPVVVNLDHDMEMYFTADSLVINSETIRLSMALSQVKGWTFGQEWNPSTPGIKPDYLPAGDGSWVTPYNTIAFGDVPSKTKNVWLTGYIVGSYTGSDPVANANLSPDGHVAANVLLASSPKITDPARCVPVLLQFSSPSRAEVNLSNNPGNHLREISILGDVTTVNGRTGLTAVTDHEWGPVGHETVGAAMVTSDIAAPVMSGSSLTFIALPEGTVVAVYDTAGRSVASHHASGDFTLDLSDLTRGVYVVTAGGKSFKIAVKK